MQITLSEREATTIVAALRAWQDPVGFISNGRSAGLFTKQPELAPEQLDYLIRRLKSFINAPAGDRLTSTNHAPK